MAMQNRLEPAPGQCLLLRRREYRATTLPVLGKNASSHSQLWLWLKSCVSEVPLMSFHSILYCTLRRFLLRDVPNLQLSGRPSRSQVTADTRYPTRIRKAWPLQIRLSSGQADGLRGRLFHDSAAMGPNPNRDEDQVDMLSTCTRSYGSPDPRFPSGPVSLPVTCPTGQLWPLVRASDHGVVGFSANELQH